MATILDILNKISQAGAHDQDLSDFGRALEISIQTRNWAISKDQFNTLTQGQKNKWLTGWLESEFATDSAFKITFFRFLTNDPTINQSRFPNFYRFLSEIQSYHQAFC